MTSAFRDARALTTAFGKYSVDLMVSGVSRYALDFATIAVRAKKRELARSSMSFSLDEAAPRNLIIAGLLRRPLLLPRPHDRWHYRRRVLARFSRRPRPPTYPRLPQRPRSSCAVTSIPRITILYEKLDKKSRPGKLISAALCRLTFPVFMFSSFRFFFLFFFFSTISQLFNPSKSPSAGPVAESGSLVILDRRNMVNTSRSGAKWNTWVKRTVLTKFR